MSGQLHDRTLHELLHRGRYLYPPDVVNVIERFHTVEGPGVPRTLVTEYVAEVLRRLGPRAPYTLQRFERLLDGRVTDLDMWVPHALFEVAPGRVSVYPARWHRELAGVRDPAPYVDVIRQDLAAARSVGPDGPLPAVPKATLVEAMVVLGDLDQPTAASLVRDARLDGRIVVEPFQNPEALVWLSGAEPSKRATPAASGAERPVADGRPGSDHRRRA
ncbi:hypothetical protein [Halomicrobium urmianum]|uniref:hypothetical protein n=1 Tax=Halomicrobium urmianum TaxID=1586233 RepID=UPI001CD93089|nr:hypothetical protein [Halomicrobium urmianum]